MELRLFPHRLITARKVTIETQTPKVKTGQGIQNSFQLWDCAGQESRVNGSVCGSVPPAPAAMDDEFLSEFPAALSPNSSEEPGWWSGSGDDEETVHFAVRCVMTSVYILIITVGLVGNITLVKIFITNSAMRSVPNIFISSLAAGDLLLLVTCVPVDAFRYLSEEWVFGEAACKLIPVIQLTSVGVSVFTLTALSADR
ncbi:unnamed protein product [Pleuronectes platessa]|uniref:G-protein coupled receptors family 1 profile domain-containing protein n=1 Tax=Pleuronectes platessa TaxID=8262 RepID=A0A9N7UW21_PLEPL|nr:unnamed protein product [Pleuronectes platessa]